MGGAGRFHLQNIEAAHVLSFLFDLAHHDGRQVVSLPIKSHYTAIESLLGGRRDVLPGDSRPAAPLLAIYRHDLLHPLPPVGPVETRERRIIQNCGDLGGEGA